jgi:hypothetical protein
MDRTLDRLRGEFLEMPGLRMTLAQAQRLCGLEPNRCKALLDGLVNVKFLSLTPDGSYARLSDVERAAATTKLGQNRNRPTSYH